MAFGNFSWGVWAPGCSVWDLVPCLGIKPRPSALGAQSLNHWTTREVHKLLLRIFFLEGVIYLENKHILQNCLKLVSSWWFVKLYFICSIFLKILTSSEWLIFLCVHFFKDSEDNILIEEGLFNSSPPISQLSTSWPPKMCLLKTECEMISRTLLFFALIRNVFWSKCTRGCSVTTLAVFQEKWEFIFIVYFVHRCAWRNMWACDIIRTEFENGFPGKGAKGLRF